MKKPSLSIIVAHGLSKKPSIEDEELPSEDDMDSPDPDDALISCCEDFLSAIKADDAVALADAFKSACELCESDSYPSKDDIGE